MKNDNELWKELASKYVMVEGRNLHAELRQIEHSNEMKTSQEFDKRLLHKIKMMRYKKYSVASGALVACLLLFLMGTQVLNQFTMNEAGTAQETPQQTNGNIISLSLHLPQDFQVSDMKQDNKKTIYYVENTKKDNVVLTVEANNGDFGHEGLKEIQINNQSAYVKSSPDYQLLTFEKDNILYVLTCQYEYNTLIELGKSII